MSHQLTPYAIVLALTACLLTRRLARPELIAIAFLLCVGWLSLGASNFWYGHRRSSSVSFGSSPRRSPAERVEQGRRRARATGSSSTRAFWSRSRSSASPRYRAARRATASRTLEMLARRPFLCSPPRLRRRGAAARGAPVGPVRRRCSPRRPSCPLVAASSVRSSLSLRLGRRGRQLLAAGAAWSCHVRRATTVVRGATTRTRRSRPTRWRRRPTSTPTPPRATRSGSSPPTRRSASRRSARSASTWPCRTATCRCSILVVKLFLTARTGVRPHRTPLQWILLGQGPGGVGRDPRAATPSAGSRPWSAAS